MRYSRIVGAITLVMVIAATMAALWLRGRVSPPSVVQDFEGCVEQAQATASLDSERADLIRTCGVRFAGRRKPSGGYTYYDFMQNRSFDIAGPNPNASGARPD
jgi:hypothetical protein